MPIVLVSTSSHNVILIAVVLPLDHPRSQTTTLGLLIRSRGRDSNPH